MNPNLRLQDQVPKASFPIASASVIHQFMAEAARYNLISMLAISLRTLAGRDTRPFRRSLAW